MEIEEKLLLGMKQKRKRENRLYGSNKASIRAHPKEQCHDSQLLHNHALKIFFGVFFLSIFVIKWTCAALSVKGDESRMGRMVEKGEKRG